MMTDPAAAESPAFGPPFPHHSTDPWTRVRTLHDLAADEVISALQKSIRRGVEENAVLCALEMIASGPALEAHLWVRLQIIAVEDVGMGDPQAIVVVRNLREAAREIVGGPHDRVLFAVAAVRYLAQAAKDRTTDEMLNVLRHEIDREGRVPEIPDWALCIHTRRGQELGRTLLEWFTDGAQVANEVPGRDEQWRRRLLALWADS